jgi:SAM-dependent methyltransferase
VELQPDLFGEPPRDLEQSQLFTPLWLAQRMANWIPRGSRILEPCCGNGNLIEGALRAGHRPTALMAVERDVRMADFTRTRFEDRLYVFARDFFDLSFPSDRFDAVLGNFPFEKNNHLRFTVRALELVPVVVGVYPVTFEFTQERDRDLWATVAEVTRRAILPDRVEYAGDGGSFESVVLRIVRRDRPRRPGEERAVIEETWRREDEVFAHLSEVP